MKILTRILLTAILLLVGIRQTAFAQTAPRQENLTTLAVGVLYSYEGGGSSGVPDKTVVQVFDLDGTLVVEGNTQGSSRYFQVPYGTYVVDAYVPFWDGTLRLLCNEVTVTVDSTVVDNGALVRCPAGYAWIYMPFLTP